MFIRFRTFSLLVFLTLLSLGCDDDTTGPTDTTRPVAVSDLEIASTTGGVIRFEWTASGDDGKNGTASYYDLRSAADSSTLRNWGGARQQQGEPVPSIQGTNESMNLPDTFSVTTFFAIKVSDEAANTSAISNIVTRVR